MKIPLKSILGGIALSVLTALTVTGRASATVYTITETDVNPTPQGCDAAADTCYISFAPTGLTTLNAGDVVDFDVAFSSPFVVPAATKSNAVFAAILDDAYFNLPGSTQVTDSATSTESVTDLHLGSYSGPFDFPSGKLSFPDGYIAYAYVRGPNAGFSITGFDATMDIDSSDPNGIYGIAIEYQAVGAPTVPEPSSSSLFALGLAGIAWIGIASGRSKGGIRRRA